VRELPTYDWTKKVASQGYEGAIKALKKLGEALK
jgi:hypothetical protein